ncbi:MAG: entericidin A/B family lipoprotein [Burkholderiales bacterium]
MKKIFPLLTLAMVLWLTGCNTINGMGKDIKATGQTIEDASKKN